MIGRVGVGMRREGRKAACDSGWQGLRGGTLFASTDAGAESHVSILGVECMSVCACK